MTYEQNRLRPRERGERPEGKSPQRVIQRPRIPDDTWLLALERCQAEHTPIGHVITELLEAWLAGEIEL
jgi:hypothetical protein